LATVVLGLILAGAMVLVRTPKREAVAVASEITTVTRSAPASGAHDPVPAREARAVREGGRADEVEVRGEQRKFSNSTVQPPTSNLPPAKVRKPIAYDPKVPKARQVLLANRRIVVEKGRSFPKKFCSAQTPTARGTAPYVVISELPVSRDVRIQAVADGARVVGFLPNNALLVEADAQALKNLEDDVLFTAAVEYEPTDKIQRALLENGERGEKGEMVETTVVLMNPKDREAIQTFVTANGGEPLRGAPSADKSLSAKIPRTLVEKLAGKAEVKWIERYVRVKPFNDVAVKPGLMNVTPVREAPLGLTGEGQIVTTSDSGIDTGDMATLHHDLTNAVIGMEQVWADSYAEDYNGHGTHTAGSLVGDGAMSGGRFKGVAPSAKLWAWFCEGYDAATHEEYFCPPMYWTGEEWCLDAAWLFRPYDIGANIHSASWGGGDFGVYSAGYCEVIDAYVWNHPDFLPVFAAGNEGNYYGGQLAENTIGQPGTAKNVLTVGASESVRPESIYPSYADNPAQIVYFSSCGPCGDGRIKPDVVAPGSFILSCLSSQAGRSDWDDGSYEHYQYMGGTSMATPLTAGAAALVREWLVRYRENANPSAALVKAVLLGGATDLFYESGNNVLGRVPDTRQGWGRVDLAASVAPTGGQGVFLADGLPFGAGSNFTFRVTTTNVAPLSVQLVWVDYPGEPAAGRMLVNDLDLCVSAGGATWLGNGGAAPDDVNNVESVRIREAAAETYVVRVTCPAVPYDSTMGGAAAVYMRGAFDPAHVRRGEMVGMVWMIL